MTIVVRNPVGYDAEAMARKFIQALAGCSPEEYVQRVERAHAQEEGE